MKENKQTISNITLKWKPTKFKKVQIKSSYDAAKYAKQFYSDDINIYESFFLLLLNSQNETIAYAKISQGGCIGTVVDVKIIAKYCIEALAQSCILFHNHPSGVLQASKEDIKHTIKIKDTLEIFQSYVLDHIILTNNGYLSMADEGIVKFKQD